MLQFVFLGHTGFRFPLAHWPTKEVDPATLYIHFWKSVYWLLQGGFSVHYCCCDGGSTNRSFIKLHFSGKDPCAEKFTTVNPYTREPLVFLMDPYVSFNSNTTKIQSFKFITISLLDGIEHNNSLHTKVCILSTVLCFRYSRKVSYISLHEKV